MAPGVAKARVWNTKTAAIWPQRQPILPCRANDIGEPALTRHVALLASREEALFMAEAQRKSERPENLSLRRTPGRSEDPFTLDEQLDTGLEDTFPASDPVSVVSTTISGKAKKLEGTDEVLARQRAERQRETTQRNAERQRLIRREEQRETARLLGIAGLAIGLSLAAVSSVLLARNQRL
jgi:hypothetical protein